MQAEMSLKLKFARARISLSHGAYSSAVRRGSVEARHWPRHVLPSWTANLVLVLPTSMARSMGSRRAGKKDIARRDQAPAFFGFEFEFAARRKADDPPFERLLALQHTRNLTHSMRPRQPRRTQR